MKTARDKQYTVGGILLDRPFKIRRLGHFGFNAGDLEASRRFYFDLLSFFVTEPAGAGYFGRHAGDHHSFALFDKKKFNERQYAGDHAKHFRLENDINQITWQVQSISEMAEASKYFRELGVEILREGRAGGGGSRFHLYVWAPDEQIFELHPGIDYAAYAFDPDGHCLELYYDMEQVGWDGKPRPKELRPKIDPNHCPEALAPLADTYTGEPFIGPWA